MSKFLVYWTPADIDRKANEIARKILGLGLVSSQVTTSAISAVAALVGNPMYYKHLLFARKVRDKRAPAGISSHRRSTMN